MSVTWSKITAVLLSLLFTVTASASTKSDSIINAEAADSNFIHASLVVIDPGEAIWSIAGHCALRMECPSKHLDYVYTFEADADGLKVLRVMAVVKEKAGYVAAPTQIFFNQYKEEKRGIRQQELNLSPKEKQNLWRCLDEAAADGLLWNMDYWQTNCVSMVTYILEKAIAPTTKITATKPSPLKGKTWGEIIDYVVGNRPWQNMAIKLVILAHKGKIGQNDDLMTPAMLIDNWQSAYLTDSTGNRRPMMKGAIKQILPPGPEIKPCWFTPSMALALIIVMTAVTTLLIVRRKQLHKANAKDTNNKRQRESQHI